MSTRGYQSSLALCPFYDSETPQKIICEGLVKCSRIHLTFGTRQSAIEYKKEYCYDDYGLCKIAQALAARYEEEQQ